MLIPDFVIDHDSSLIWNDQIDSKYLIQMKAKTIWWGDDKLEMVQVWKQKKSKYKDFDNDLMIVHLHICVPIA